jgi:clan AA aspartic protease
MKGFVDEIDRALLNIEVGSDAVPDFENHNAWIDTGFTGGLALPQEVINRLALPDGPVVTAVLADGSTIVVNTYTAAVKWFGPTLTAEVVPKAGDVTLLGTQLMRHHKLTVDYRKNTVSLD